MVGLIFQVTSHVPDLLQGLMVAAWAVEAGGSQEGQSFFNAGQLLIQIAALVAPFI